jgi:hypothetical protein
VPDVSVKNTHRRKTCVHCCVVFASNAFAGKWFPENGCTLLRRAQVHIRLLYIYMMINMGSLFVCILFGCLFACLFVRLCCSACLFVLLSPHACMYNSLIN